MGGYPQPPPAWTQRGRPAGERGGCRTVDINLFTALMRSEFLRSMQATAKPAPYEEFTQEIPSTARLENYAWMTPAPGISKYLGKRRAAQLDQTKYTIPNVEYDGTLSVPTRDIEDDQVGGYKIRMGQLAEKAKKPFKSRLVLQNLADGKTNPCFDGSAFFASTHNVGSAGTAPAGFTGGGNLLAFTSANSADAVVHRFAILVNKGSEGLPPLLYQNRKEAQLETDAGTPQSKKAKKADYWIDLEAAAGYGYWWDAILCEITNTPSLIDLFACIDACRRMFRTFQLPKALPTDPVERVHEQTQFNAENATIVTSTGLEQLFGHALNEDRVGVSVAGSTAGITSNIYYKSFGLVTTGYLD